MSANPAQAGAPIGAAAPARPIADASYRPDIDGLRAVAVAGVVVFHAMAAYAPGGFVGVDVFFVISGYLIGGQILAEVRAGGFSYLSFYARRARRILPALYAMLAVMMLAGVWFLTPIELRQLGKESVAAIFAAPNVLYYGGQGYFAPYSNPLLMTWSLGVEEQFYLLLPVLMLAIARVGGPPATLILALCGVSFAASIVLTHLDPKAAFYLLPTRAWELGLGVALAVMEKRGCAPRISGWTADGVAFLSLAAIVLAMAFYKPDYAFPGFYALIPTIAAAGLILSRGSSVNRLALGSAPLVFIGKISYSLYLWHWPLFYLNGLLKDAGAGLHPFALIAIAFGLAVASWVLVEQPFRRRVHSPRAVLWRYAVAGGALAAFALALYGSYGWPQRFAGAEELSRDAHAARQDLCLTPFGSRSPTLEPPCAPASAIAPAVVVIGDSHAASIAPGFRMLADQDARAFMQLTKSSCPPLAGFAPASANRSFQNECRAYQGAVFENLRKLERPAVVVLAGYWSSTPSVTSANGKTTPLLEALETTLASLSRTGHRIVVVQDTPRFAFDPYALAVGETIPLRAAMSGVAADRGVADAEPARVLRDETRALMRDVASRWPEITLFDPWESLCRDGRCAFRDEHALFYSDFQHLTEPGAKRAVVGLTLPSS
jgi:peptidoglycan/LPS O-acetylase OafA/YrhL